MLTQFNNLRGDTAYDVVLLLSDEGSYELSKNNKTVPNTPAPLWILHLGGLPGAYNDGIIKSLQDSGGVAVDISEILQRIATKSVLGDSVVSVVNGYAWYLQTLDTAIATSNQQDDFLPNLISLTTGYGRGNRRTLHRLSHKHNITISIDNPSLSLHNRIARFGHRCSR